MQRHPVPARPARGFTLIETMVVIALLVIVASLAAPSMQSVVAKQRLRSATYDLVSDLTLARSEAVRRAGYVSVEPGSADWTQGWSVKFTQSDGSSLILGKRNPTGSALTFSPRPALVAFTPQGAASGATSDVKIGIADGWGNARCVILDPTGRPKSLAAACP